MRCGVEEHGKESIRRGDIQEHHVAHARNCCHDIECEWTARRGGTASVEIFLKRQRASRHLPDRWCPYGIPSSVDRSGKRRDRVGITIGCQKADTDQATQIKSAQHQNQVITPQVMADWRRCEQRAGRTPLLLWKDKRNRRPEPAIESHSANDGLPTRWPRCRPRTAWRRQ